MSEDRASATPAATASRLPVLIEVRERTFAELLDLAVAVIRRHPAPILSAWVIGSLPFVMLNGYLIDPSALPGQQVVQQILLILLEVPFATAPLTLVMGGLMFGQVVSPMRALKTTLMALPKLILYQGFLRGLLLITNVIGAWAIPSYLGFANEVILLERSKWGGVWGRSGRLAEGQAGEMVGRSLLALMITAAFILILANGLGMIERALFDRVSWVNPFASNDTVMDWRSQLACWLAVGFFGVVRFLTYIDQRTRREGWELVLRLRSMGRTLRERQSW